MEQIQKKYSAELISEMPRNQRPRERLRSLGAGHLSDAELIAILLRVGVQGEGAVSLAGRLLDQFGGLTGLIHASVADMSNLRGISDVKAAHIQAALELGRRMNLIPDNRPAVGSPEELYYTLGADMGALTQETLKVVLLNSKNQVDSVVEVYRGTVNSADVRVAEVLRPAIRENSPAFIVVHNHPSGDPTPSPEDILVTRRISKGAKEVEIDLYDHMIIGHRSFVSMKRRNLGF